MTLPDSTTPSRVTVLTNPMAGHGNAPHAAEKAVARFQQLDSIGPTVFFTAQTQGQPVHTKAHQPKTQTGSNGM